MERVKPKEGGELLDLLDALIYGDVFDCAVTLDELWQYARVAIDRDQLRRRLRDDAVLRRVVVERNGFYCLCDKTALLDERPRRIVRARRLQRRARTLARLLRHLPFVRGLLLTGSVSADDATKNADIDFLVIAAPGRIGTAFLLLGPLSRLLGRSIFCPNWYMNENILGIPQGSLYISREFAQARNLAGKADALCASNPWIQEVFPNATPPSALESGLRESSRLQRLLETSLRGNLGELLERMARGIAAARLRIHYSRFGLEIPTEVAERFEAGVALGFHGYRYEQTTLEAHATRRADVQRRLEQVATEGA